MVNFKKHAQNKIIKRHLAPPLEIVFKKYYVVADMMGLPLSIVINVTPLS